MKLIDMKIRPKKNTLRGATKGAEVPDMPEEPAYPWGLEVSLNEDSIKKLNVDVENISAGDDVYFIAKATVNRILLNEIGLQIQKMHWGKPGKDF